MSTYTVVYARGAAHLRGLEVADSSDRGTDDAPAWTYSACSALSRNRSQWCTYKRTAYTDLADAIEALEDCGRYYAKGVCAKCAKTAAAQLAATATEGYAEKFERVFGL